MSKSRLTFIWDEVERRFLPWALRALGHIIHMFEHPEDKTRPYIMKRRLRSNESTIPPKNPRPPLTETQIRARQLAQAAQSAKHEAFMPWARRVMRDSTDA